MLNYKFNTYETKAYVYCAGMGKPVLVQPLGEFDTHFLFIYLKLLLIISNIRISNKPSRFFKRLEKFPSE